MKYNLAAISQDLDKLQVKELCKKYNFSTYAFRKNILPMLSEEDRDRYKKTRWNTKNLQKLQIDLIIQDLDKLGITKLCKKYNFYNDFFYKNIFPMLNEEDRNKFEKNKWNLQSNSQSKKLQIDLQDLDKLGITKLCKKYNFSGRFFYKNIFPMLSEENRDRFEKNKWNLRSRSDKQRNDDIITLHKDGKTLAVIGTMFNISHERVRQIIQKQIPNDNLKRIMQKRTEIHCAKVLADLLNNQTLLDEIKKQNENGMSLKNIRKKHKIKNNIIWKIIKEKLNLKAKSNDSYQNVIGLYSKGFSYRKISEILGICKGAVSKHISKYIAQKPSERRSFQSKGSNMLEDIPQLGGSNMEDKVKLDQIKSLDDALKLIKEQQNTIISLKKEMSVGGPKQQIEIFTDNVLDQHLNNINQPFSDIAKEAINKHLDNTINELKKLGFHFDDGRLTGTRKIRQIFKYDLEKISKGKSRSQIGRLVILHACLRKHFGLEQKDQDPNLK